MNMPSRILLPALALGSLVLWAAPAAAQMDDDLPEPDFPAVTDEMVDDTGTAPDDITVGELQSILNLPLTVRIKEYQEDLENPPSIFKDEATIQRIFGDSPPFIYFPEGVDPMIIPWIRERIIAEELFQEATIATANRDYDKALDILRQIRENFPGTASAENAPAEMARVEQLRQRERDELAGRQPVGEEFPAGPQDAEVVLPDWIRANTNGVLLGTTPVVVIHNDFLRVGDQVPRYPAVRVKEITSSEVTYTYQNKEFTIEVVGTF